MAKAVLYRRDTDVHTDGESESMKTLSLKQGKIFFLFRGTFKLYMKQHFHLEKNPQQNQKHKPMAKEKIFCLG